MVRCVPHSSPLTGLHRTQQQSRKEQTQCGSAVKQAVNALQGTSLANKREVKLCTKMQTPLCTLTLGQSQHKRSRAAWRFVRHSASAAHAQCVALAVAA